MSFEASGLSCNELDAEGFLFITLEEIQSRNLSYACLEIKEVFLLRNWLTKQIKEREYENV